MMTWLVRAGLENPARNAIIGIALVAIVLVPGLGAVDELYAQDQSASPTVVADNDLPVLAYYYIWFDPSSWNRAKTDYPVLGRYSSDDPAVLRQHVQWAKAAGIDGFIVSWKNANRLSPRLKRLTEVARDEDFKLVIIYQGLDFERDPLSIDQIAQDLDYFTENFASDEVFNLFGKPAHHLERYLGVLSRGDRGSYLDPARRSANSCFRKTGRWVSSPCRDRRWQRLLLVIGQPGNAARLR